MVFTMAPASLLRQTTAATRTTPPPDAVASCTPKAGPTRSSPPRRIRRSGSRAAPSPSGRGNRDTTPRCRAPPAHRKSARRSARGCGAAPRRGPQQDMVIGRMDGPEVAHLHLRRHAARLELAEDDPAADLVGQRRLDPAVQRVDPALKLRTRPPAAHDLVSLLVKLHAQPLRAVRVAAEAVIPLQPAPRIDNLLHVG